MHPWQCAIGGVQRAVVAAVVMKVVAVVVLVVVGESHGMILCLKIFHFKRFLKKGNGRTDPLIEMRGRIQQGQESTNRCVLRATQSYPELS